MKSILNKVLEKHYKRKTTLHLSLDVGTEWIKAFVFKITPDGVGHILGVGRVKQKLTDMHNGAIADIAGVVENCEKALKQAEDTAGGIVDDVTLGIAGELVKGELTKIQYDRHTPTSKIDVAELDKIIEKVQREALLKTREEIKRESGTDDVEIKLVNSSITHIEIDNQKVTNPLGFQGRSVELSVFNAVAPLTSLGALETVSEELGLDLLTIAAEPYAVASAVLEKGNDEMSAILIDVGGGTTGITVIQKGGVMGTKEFAFGGRAYTKRLAKLLDETILRAEEIKLEYAHSKTSHALASKIAPVFEADTEIWLSGLELALEEFNLPLLPDKILLSGGASKLPEIVHALSGDWHVKLPFAKKPKVDFINPADVTMIKDETGKLIGPEDITALGLMKIAMGVYDAEERPALEQALNRVIQIIES